MSRMRNLATILAVYCVCFLALPVEAVEPPAKPSLAKRSLKLVKRGLMLPVYVIGGAGAGVIVWANYGGEEDKLKALFQGLKK